MESSGAGVAGASDEVPRRGKQPLSQRPPSQVPSRSASVRLLLSLLHDIPRAVSDRVHLAALELRRARHAFLRMVVLAVVAAILAATAWLALWAVIVHGLFSLGMPWYVVAVHVLLFNGLGAWFAIRAADALADDLTLPATVRCLTVRSSAASQSLTRAETRAEETAANDVRATEPGPIDSGPLESGPKPREPSS